MKIQSMGQASLQGGRDQNQDSILTETLPNGWVLAAVCDGMGGLDDGKMASVLALNRISAHCQANYQFSSPAQLMRDAIEKAYDAILQQSIDNEIRLGTTVALLLLTPETACVAHLGDSRVYQIRKGRILFRTTDHSKAFQHVQAGVMTEEEARIHPDSNKLTKGLIPDRFDQPDIMELSYRKGDLFFLCSDGVWNLRSEQELIHLITSEPNAQSMVPWLLHSLDDAANNDGGGHDNLSAIALYTSGSSRIKTVSRNSYLFWLGILLAGFALSLGGVRVAFPELFTSKDNSLVQQTPSNPTADESLQDSLEKAMSDVRILRDSLEYYRSQNTQPVSTPDEPELKKSEKKPRLPITKPQAEDSTEHKKLVVPQSDQDKAPDMLPKLPEPDSTQQTH